MRQHPIFAVSPTGEATAYGKRTEYRNGQPVKPVKAPRKPIKLTLTGKTLVLGLIMVFVTLIVGICVGHASALSSPDAHRPDSATLNVLKYAQYHGAKGCKIEWSTTYNAWDVVCTRPIQLTNLDADRDPQ